MFYAYGEDIALSVCYFGGNTEIKYQCQYELIDGISISVEYDISDEIEAVNGLKMWTTATEFEPRDIIIADPDSSSYYLVKSAYYSGHTARYGSVDDRTISIFKSNSYFKCSSLESVLSISNSNSFSSIKIYSQEIYRQLENSSLSYTRTDEVTQISLKNKTEKEEVQINLNNINRICISDDWNCHRDGREHIDIKLTGYIDIKLEAPAPFDEIYQYLKELAVYLQLYKPGAFSFERIQMLIDEEYADYCVVFDEINIDKHSRPNSVEDKLIHFLESCYKTIPYRDGKEETRNIPYIISRRYRSIEDNFLSCFRFVECYYKRTTNLTSNIDVLKKALSDHPQRLSSFSTLGSNYINEIVALRNQYVHTGYYLKNYTLERKDRHGNVVEVYSNITFYWIYERTKLLYQLVMDIIFKAMLGYATYNYDYR